MVAGRSSNVCRGAYDAHTSIFTQPVLKENFDVVARLALVPYTDSLKNPEMVCKAFVLRAN